MGSLHDRAAAALRQAMLTRAQTLLRTLDTAFEERSVHAALQARRQLADMRALARFLEDRALQQPCIALQRALLALGPAVLKGIPEVQSRPVLRLALQIRWQACTLGRPARWHQRRDERAALLAPDLHVVLLGQVRRRLRLHEGLGEAENGTPWQVLRAAAVLADVLPASALLATDELQALLRWEQHLQRPVQTPSDRLLSEIAERLAALCEEQGASPRLRTGLAIQHGPLSQRTVYLLQQTLVLLDFTRAGTGLRRALEQTLRLARLVHSWECVPLLTATALPVVVRPLLLRMLLRLQDDLARAASGNPQACAGLLAAQLEEALRHCLRQQHRLAGTQILELILGATLVKEVSTISAMQAVAQEERAAALQSLQHWQRACAQHPGPHPLPDVADLAVTRLTHEALLTGDLALHELLILLGQCFTLARERQQDAGEWLLALAEVLPFVGAASRRWQRDRVLRNLLGLEARLRVRSSAGVANVALELARGLQALPCFSVSAFLQQEVSPEAFTASNRQVLMELRMLASGARALQVQRIAELSAAMAQVHVVLAQVTGSAVQFLHSTAGVALLTQAHAALRRGLNQAAARQETSECRALLGALYDWLACYGEQAAGRAGFVHEAQALMQQIVSAGTDQQRLHALHTLKGNAALYRCEPIVQLCHRSERTLLHSSAHAQPAGPHSAPSVREPAALSPLLTQLQQAVAQLVADAPAGVRPITCKPAGENPAAPDPVTAGSACVPTSGAPLLPEDLRVCRLLATRLRSGLQSLLDLLQPVDLVAASARQHLALELLQEQLAQAAELEEDLLAAPQVQFARLAPRLRRVLEDTAHRQGKVARLEICAAGHCVERPLLAKLVAPLEHLLRNAVVHGIELPAQRRACGKPESGRVRVLLSGTCGALQLGVEDDGQGVQTTQLLFELGTSRQDASPDAGHGLGLAAVKAAVEALGGTVTVQSRPGQGTCFWLQMPENSGLGDIHAMPL